MNRAVAASRRFRSKREDGPTRGDAVLALAAFALTLLLLGHLHGSASRNLDPLGGLLAAAGTLPLLWHRRAPLTVFAITTAASATLNGLNYALGPPVGPTIALFFVAADERTRVRLGRTAGVVVGFFALHVGATMIAHHGFPTSPLLFGILVWGGAWLIGDQVLQRRTRREVAEERARQREREVKRERRLAAAEERTRIARDLHDSAAHAINVILVQAGAARLLQQKDPTAATAALSTIEEVARETIGEIDNLVHGLREDAAADRPNDVEPPTGLSALDTLVDRYRAAGLQISVGIEGERRSVPQRLDQAAYRILQESLTNAARHGSGSASITITYGATGLGLRVSNPVSGRSTDNGAGRGHGILGMRERAALLGGSLDASPTTEGFLVRASLPYPTSGARP
jgi:signal transduction histidine kinase